MTTGSSRKDATTRSMYSGEQTWAYLRSRMARTDSWMNLRRRGRPVPRSSATKRGMQSESSLMARVYSLLATGRAP